MKKNNFDKILIVQTAFTGDVILATSLLENLHQKFPNARIDFLLRKGNENLLENHPFLNKILIWNKNKGKYKSLLKNLIQARKEKYDLIINLQRFASSGIFTILAGAKETRGFSKNPLSFFFTKKFPHQIGNFQHEIERNFSLIKNIVSNEISKPKIYPQLNNFDKIKKYTETPFVVMAPASVWFTKQLPEKKWVELCNQIPQNLNIYLIGAPGDLSLCENIRKNSCFGNANEPRKNKCIVLAGKLSLLDSAALISKAAMNYVNDSAPLHLASATNSPVTAFFCSTLPQFGFGPLSDNSKIAETNRKLKCRPCGIHGKKVCPEKHFECGNSIDIRNFNI